MGPLRHLGSRLTPKRTQARNKVTAIGCNTSDYHKRSPLHLRDLSTALDTALLVAPTLPPTLWVATIIVSTDASENFLSRIPYGQLSDYLLPQNPREADNGAHVSVPRKKKGKWGLVD